MNSFYNKFIKKGEDYMKNEELILSISKMLDDKINPLEKRMDSMENDLKREIGTVKNEVELVKDEVKLVKDEVKLVKNEVNLVKEEVKHVENQIKLLEDRIDHIDLKLENVFEPRMNTIESCYMDTYKRYQRGVDKIDKLESDNELIRTILQKHSKMLQTQIV